MKNANVSTSSKTNNSIPVAGHIRLAGKMQKAIEALDDLRADAMNLLPSHDQQRQRLETLIDGLIKHGGRLSDVRCHLDTNYNKSIAYDHFKAMKGWQPYFDRSAANPDAAFIAALGPWASVHPADKKRLLEGLPSLLNQLMANADDLSREAIVAGDILGLLEAFGSIDRYIIADGDHFTNRMTLPANAGSVRAPAGFVPIDDCFSIEIFLNGEHHIILCLSPQFIGIDYPLALVVPFVWDVDSNRWLLPAAIGVTQADGGQEMPDQLYVLPGAKRYFEEADGTEEAPCCSTCRLLDMKGLNEAYYRFHRVALGLARRFCVLSNHGLMRLYRAPKGSRNLMIGHSFVCRSEGLPMEN